MMIVISILKANQKVRCPSVSPSNGDANNSGRGLHHLSATASAAAAAASNFSKPVCFCSGSGSASRRHCARLLASVCLEWPLGPLVRLSHSAVHSPPPPPLISQSVCQSVWIFQGNAMQIQLNTTTNAAPTPHMTHVITITLLSSEPTTSKVVTNLSADLSSALRPASVLLLLLLYRWPTTTTTTCWRI